MKRKPHVFDSESYEDSPPPPLIRKKLPDSDPSIFDDKPRPKSHSRLRDSVSKRDPYADRYSIRTNYDDSPKKQRDPERLQALRERYGDYNDSSTPQQQPEVAPPPPRPSVQRELEKYFQYNDDVVGLNRVRDAPNTLPLEPVQSAEYDSEIESLKRERDEYKRERDEYKHIIREYEARINEQQRQIDMLRNEIQQRDSEIVSLKRKCDTLIQKYERQVSDLSRKYDSVKHDKEALSRNDLAQQAKITSLEHQISVQQELNRNSQAQAPINSALFGIHERMMDGINRITDRVDNGFAQQRNESSQQFMQVSQQLNRVESNTANLSQLLHDVPKMIGYMDTFNDQLKQIAGTIPQLQFEVQNMQAYQERITDTINAHSKVYHNYYTQLTNYLQQCHQQQIQNSSDFRQLQQYMQNASQQLGVYLQNGATLMSGLGAKLDTVQNKMLDWDRSRYVTALRNRHRALEYQREALGGLHRLMNDRQQTTTAALESNVRLPDLRALPAPEQLDEDTENRVNGRPTRSQTEIFARLHRQQQRR